MASGPQHHDEKFQEEHDERSLIQKSGDGLAASAKVFEDNSEAQRSSGGTIIAQEEERSSIIREFAKNLALNESRDDPAAKEVMRADTVVVLIPEVNVYICEHMLNKMRYSARTRLSDSLDANGIDKLIHHVSGDDFIDIWRECNGGNQPAFGLIYLLAQSKLVTLRKFKEKALMAEPQRSQNLIDIINIHHDKMDTRLDKLPFTLLLQITGEISANPFPIVHQARPLWKSIGSEFDLDVSLLDSLDIPAVRANLRESMTMKFIEIMNQRYPSRKVAWLAKGLKDIQRNDLLRDRKVFGQCIEFGCVILPP